MIKLETCWPCNWVPRRLILPSVKDPVNGQLVGFVWFGCEVRWK